MEDAGDGVVITFDGLARAEANQAALGLRRWLLVRVEGLSAEIEKEDPNPQDLGTTLVLLFGKGAAIAIAEGIQVWLAKRGSPINITTRAGEVVLTGDAAKNVDVAALACALAKHARR